MSGWLTKFDPRLAGKASFAKKPEQKEQQLVIAWRDKYLGRHPELKWLISIPNGGYHLPMLVAMAMKRMGVRSGPSDLFLPVPMPARGCPAGDHGCWFHGLWVEMKAIQTRPHPSKEGAYQLKLGDVKDEQIEWLEGMREQGYAATIAWNANEAQDALLKYLAGEWENPPLAWLLAGSVGSW